MGFMTSIEVLQFSPNCRQLLKSLWWQLSSGVSDSGSLKRATIAGTVQSPV